MKIKIDGKYCNVSFFSFLKGYIICGLFLFLLLTAIVNLWVLFTG